MPTLCRVTFNHGAHHVTYEGYVEWVQTRTLIIPDPFRGNGMPYYVDGMMIRFTRAGQHGLNIARVYDAKDLVHIEIV